MWRMFFLLGGALWAAGSVSAQLIPVKTAPVAVGSQFRIVPGDRYGMGGVSIAVRDPLGDAVENPAKAARLENSLVFSAPVYYTSTGRDDDAGPPVAGRKGGSYYAIAGRGGGGRTLPLGVIVQRDRWFGGLGVALQQLDIGRTRQIFELDYIRIGPPSPDPSGRFRESSAQNQYVVGLAGRRLSDRWVLGGKALWGGLDAMSGVEPLYPRYEGIRQAGHRLDLRLGLLGEWRERTVNAVLVHDRLDVSHKVMDVREWDEESNRRESGRRIREFFDRTNTWGLHVEYVRSLRAERWRLGGLLTANRKGHSALPTYEFRNVALDEGTSWAYNVGVGLARAFRDATVGVDLLFEPVFRDTWAITERAIFLGPERGLIRGGEKTIENDFNFANTTARLGGRLEKGWLELQTGMEVHTVRYWLTQQSHIEQKERNRYEAWSEWRLTWGLGLDWEGIQIRYTGGWKTGVGRPGVAGKTLDSGGVLRKGDTVPLRQESVLAEEAPVFTHQVTLTIPISVSTRP